MLPSLCLCTSARSASSSSGQQDSGAVQLAPRNIWCVGRNYAEHAKELGNPVNDEEPMIFLKAGSTILQDGLPLPLPVWSQHVNHEIEMAVELGANLQPVRVAVALDLTARDVQATLKARQWPWTLAKSFPASSPCAPATSCAGLDLSDLSLHLTVNGKTRQRGHTADMLFSVPTLLHYILDRFPVMPGDVILTGTPAGCSMVVPGDVLVAELRTGPPRGEGEGAKEGRLLSRGAWDAVQGPALTQR
ncbi:MAG: hypothetical protein WDW36_000725 [Sanguina aurantia]